MSPEQFFDEVDVLYKESEKIYENYQRPHIYRGRQHSISSLAEDLLAAFLFDNLKPQFQNIDLYFMVDYPIQPENKGNILMPDIAVIVEINKAMMVSYIDLKTDLGYKRGYFKKLPTVVSYTQRVRSAKTINKTTYNGKPISVCDNLIWRTVVISDKNISRELLVRNKLEAEASKDFFKLYFLSGNKHPNRKKREKVKIYNDTFIDLINDIKQDIVTAIPFIEN